MKERDEKLIADVLALVERVLRAPYDADMGPLRRDAQIMLRFCEAQQKRFRAEHGPKAANPTVRAWYLLSELTQHATLLRPPSGGGDL